MRAAFYRGYGAPDVLQIGEMEKPVPKDDEVLIEVVAASANAPDWRFMRGSPSMLRMMSGWRRPKYKPGLDVAGRVAATGPKATHFKPGDALFGACRGAFAEYACGSESQFARVPDNLTFEQAASAPIAGYTALQGLRDIGRLRPGQTVLINGAAGGVGTFAVQIAKALGADVTGVCSTRNVELVRSIGADHVVDYTQEDFTRAGRRYDVIFDCVGNHSLSECKRALNPNGTCVIAGAPKTLSIGWLLAHWMAPLLFSRFGKQRFEAFIARANARDLACLCDLLATGKVKPVIDKRYPLGEVSEAIGYLEGGHARGKVVITV